MTQTKKQAAAERVRNLIAQMEQNTFLFPKGWSDTIQMTHFEWAYRAYHAGHVGDARYHNVEIFLLGKKIMEIAFRGNKIEVQQDLSQKAVTIDEVEYYITEIYNEMHTFKNHASGVREIRKKLVDKLQSIKQLNNEVQDLKQQICHSKQHKHHG